MGLDDGDSEDTAPDRDAYLEPFVRGSTATSTRRSTWRCGSARSAGDQRARAQQRRRHADPAEDVPRRSAVEHGPRTRRSPRRALGRVSVRTTASWPCRRRLTARQQPDDGLHNVWSEVRRWDVDAGGQVVGVHHHLHQAGDEEVVGDERPALPRDERRRRRVASTASTRDGRVDEHPEAASTPAAACSSEHEPNGLVGLTVEILAHPGGSRVVVEHLDHLGSVTGCRVGLRARRPRGLPG